ncbi:MAG: molybdopterin-dependent oxidoreductase [Methanomassiliicoccales archaeon]|nr:molybdopterin-dependent oxidoreductase [Methanomassiliicoccales archaeon]
MKGGRSLGLVRLEAASLVVAALMTGLSLDSDEMITPNDEFFQVSLGPPPPIDVYSWRLKVDGMVERPMNLTYDEVVAFENVTEKAELRCVTGPSATAYYTGVPLTTFLDVLGVKEGAREVAFFCADSLLGENYSTSLTLDEARREGVLLAWGMNNVTLPVEQGFPLKLIVPGDWGYKWAKWIVRISVIDYDFKGYWESRGWADSASIRPISDWKVHAVLLSFAAVLGGMAALSGLRNSASSGLSSRVPDIFPRKYHRYLSAAYYVLMLLVFIYWVLVTLDYRSAVFYTLHGRIALLAVAFSLLGIATGIPLLTGMSRLRTLHFVSNFGGYALLLIAVALGVLLAIG